jgi:hypothetical protein
MGVNNPLCAAEETNAVKGRTEELREQLKAMSPAERDAKLKELREKYNRPRPERELVEKRRQELKNLLPAERQAKLREWRALETTNSNKVPTFTPEQRAAKRKELRLRLQAHMDEVRTNKNLSAENRKRFLDRMQEVAKTFDRSPEAEDPSTQAEK